MERYRLPESTPGDVYDRIAGLAAQVFDAPIVTVSIVDRERNWFLAVRGFDAGRYLPRDQSLCASVVSGHIPHVVADVREHARAAENRFVRRHHVRAYACTPIVASDGHTLGTVAVLYTDARATTEDQLGVLQNLAAIVMAHLDVQQSGVEAVRAERRRGDAAEYASADARRDRDQAVSARDEARRDRNDAQSDRREAEAGRHDARQDRDSAIRDRDTAEHERDEIEEYATVLQRTLLPPLLPTVDGLSLGAHYHPASRRQVGGDFYDAFAVGDDRWAFFIGDVEGHGVEAAVATSLIRYTLRAAALHYRDPARGLAELNEVMLRELDSRRFCTVLFGTIEPHAVDGVQITVATGGHPPALLLDPTSATATPIRSSGGMFVGAVASATFDACSVHLRPGQTLLLYTDGIIEARRGDDPFDEDALANFCAERASLDVAGLIGDLATLIPKLDPDDDVAVLAISADR